MSATEKANLVPGLQEEIQFLKRNYEIEIGLVRDSYENKLKSVQESVQTSQQQSIHRDLNMDLRPA